MRIKRSRKFKKRPLRRWLKLKREQKSYNKRPKMSKRRLREKSKGMRGKLTDK